jgi:hypothetical protein
VTAVMTRRTARRIKLMSWKEMLETSWKVSD